MCVVWSLVLGGPHSATHAFHATHAHAHAYTTHTQLHAHTHIHTHTTHTHTNKTQLNQQTRTHTHLRGVRGRGPEWRPRPVRCTHKQTNKHTHTQAHTSTQTQAHIPTHATHTPLSTHHTPAWSARARPSVAPSSGSMWRPRMSLYARTVYVRVCVYVCLCGRVRVRV